MRDGTAEPVSRNGDREMFISAVQLTTSRIGQPYSVDPSSTLCYNYTYTLFIL